MSQRVFLEESASLRSHLLALHAFPKAVSRVAANAKMMLLTALADIDYTATQWAALKGQGTDGGIEAEEGLAAATRWHEAVQCEALLFGEQMTVYCGWMEETLQAAHQAVLEGLCVFAKAHTTYDEEEEEECEDEELVYVDSYVRSSLPENSEIPPCYSIGEAAQRLEETVLPALREARGQLDLSWRHARVDWPDDGAEDYEANHYAEIDRASEGLERLLENLTLRLETAMQGLPKPPRR